MSADADLVAMRGDVARELQALDDQLVAAARRLAARLERLAESVGQGMSVNDLGEVQQDGPAVDRLCALRQAKASELARLSWLVDHAEVAR